MLSVRAFAAIALSLALSGVAGSTVAHPADQPKYGGILRMRGPNGEELAIDCSVRRCRPAVNGWFEGAMSFNREQWSLAAEHLPPRETGRS